MISQFMRVFSLTAAASLAILTGPAQAFSQRTSVIAVTGVNGVSQFDLQDPVYRFDGGLNAVNASFDINGLQSDGQTEATMTYTVAATSQSGFGGLHVSYDTSITNPFTGPNPNYDPVSGSGVPTWLGGQAYASFLDDLVVTGGPGLSSVRLLVRMEGSLGQSSPSYPYSAGYAALWNAYPSGGSMVSGAYITTSPGGFYDQTFLTNAFTVNGGIAQVGVGLQASVDWGLEYLPQGQNVTSTIDFSNTAQVIGIQGFDSNGNSVVITSAIGLSGTVYPLSPVPEPETWAMLLAGLGMVAVAARRRKACGSA